MTDESFMDIDIAREKLDEESFLTFFTLVEGEIYIAKPCALKVLWSAPIGIQESFAFPKGSPLLPFFKHTYQKIRQSGALDRSREKWKQKDKPSKCVNKNTTKPIYFEKVASLIVLLFFGTIFAFSVLLLEKIFMPSKILPICHSEESTRKFEVLKTMFENIDENNETKLRLLNEMKKQYQ